MINAIKIRPANPNEANSLSQIARAAKAHWGYSKEFMDQCYAELTVSASNISSSSFRFFVAERNQEILGYYSVQIVSPVELELDAMFVDPSAIGSGIGRLLVEHAMEVAADLNANSVIVQSDPNAEAFYRHMGARVIGTRESESVSGRMLPILRFIVENTELEE